MPDESESRWIGEFPAGLTLTDLARTLAETIPYVDNSYFSRARWFQHKHVKISRKRLRDIGVMISGESIVMPTIVDIDFEVDDSKGEGTESYYVPALLRSRHSMDIDQDHPAGSSGALGPSFPSLVGPGVFLHVDEVDKVDKVDEERGLTAFSFYDGVASPIFINTIVDKMRISDDLPAMRGRFHFRGVGKAMERYGKITAAYTLPGEHSNSLVVVEDEAGYRGVLKVFRRLLAGISPELEMLLRLQLETQFRAMPLVHGYMNYYDESRREHTIYLLQEFLQNSGDAWGLFLECLGRGSGTDEYVEALAYLVADLHFALASLSGPDFVAEPVTASDLDDIRRRAKQNLAELVSVVKMLMTRQMDSHNDGEHGHGHKYNGGADDDVGKMRIATRAMADEIRDMAEEIAAGRREFEMAIDSAIDSLVPGVVNKGKTKGGAWGATGAGAKFRIHGDLHLGQFLWSGQGSSFAVIDFEGEPLRGIGQRRLKESPLRDVAGVLRSFDYAVHLAHAIHSAHSCSTGSSHIERARVEWLEHTEKLFIVSYLRHTMELGGRYVPEGEGPFTSLLTLFKLEKAMYEVFYEVGNRPGWVGIPLAGLVGILRGL